MKHLRVFAGIWLGLFFLFLPFPFEILPEVGTFLSRLGIPVTAALSGTESALLEQTAGHSDSIHQYILVPILGVLAALATFVLARYPRHEKTLSTLLPKVITYILAFFLINYGIEKITQLQFPEPPPNILHTPFGKLDKDILFWSTMGTSGFYGWFMGITEITAGILLIAHRTRFIGALAALGIFANIFAINMGFDITVKLLSFSLVCASAYLIAPMAKPLLRVLIGKAVVARNVHQELALSPYLKRGLKGFAVLAIFLECVVPLFNRETFWADTDLIGHSFEITEERNPASNLFPTDVRRLHFHPSGSLIFETFEGQFISQPIRYHKGYSTFQLDSNKQRITVERHEALWIFTSNDAVIWVCRKTENEDLPALQDTFHWTVESMIPE